MTVVLLWTAWCVLHSLLIAAPVTAWLAARGGLWRRGHRLGYNVISAVTLLGLVAYTGGVRGAPVWTWEGAWRAPQVVLLAAAAGLFVAGARRYDALQWLGLRQLRGGAGAGLSSTGGLASAGILRLVRHPWYTATFAVLWARPLAVVDLLVNGVLTVYLVVGTRLEERKLAREFGDAYRDYQRQVSMYLPLKWLSRRLRSQPTRQRTATPP